MLNPAWDPASLAVSRGAAGEDLSKAQANIKTPVEFTCNYGEAAVQISHGAGFGRSMLFGGSMAGWDGAASAGAASAGAASAGAASAPRSSWLEATELLT